MSFRMSSLAAGTMNQLQQKMDMIAHNLANSNTVGYKERQTEFSDMLSQQINNLTPADQAGPRRTPDGLREGMGARLGAINSNLEMGSIQVTERELDNVLRNEKHLFQVQAEHNGQQEVQYTRDGSFYLQPVGNGDDMMLVTQDGLPVLGQNGAIQFSGADVERIQMDEAGNLYVKRAGQVEDEIVGTLALSEATFPRALETVGDNLFRIGEEFANNNVMQAVQNDDRVIQNGAIEMSNVSMQDQMTDLINAQRSYQMNARSVTMSDQMQGLVNQLR